MSFGGGGSGSGPVTAHKHNAQSGEGGPLQMNNSTTAGTTFQINGGSELKLEALV
tara:strand:- start:603 stop:767 length:165 start_codon:yes stop_codon:yes gene_type:complete